jgi:hypothetical protein
MTMIAIDGQQYNLDTLSPTAKEQLQSLQFVDNELTRISAQSAVLQTARVAYANALRQELARTLGDTLKFS